jgi:hypothetical protein
MPKTITVKLRTPIVGHGAPVTEVIVREPAGKDLMELGEPYSFIRTPKEGVPIFNEYVEIVQAYIQRCVTAPKADWLLLEGQLSLIDALAVKEALLGFFLAAHLELSRERSDSSSSTSSGSAPATSGT